jgi:hypothetical protein
MQLPKGWELVRFGKPEVGEYFLDMDGDPQQQTEITLDWWSLDGPGRLFKKLPTEKHYALTAMSE